MASNSLQDLRIVVTRTRTQASQLRAELERRGATCVEIPALELEDLEGWETSVFGEPRKFLGITRPSDTKWDWTVVTSKNAAERVARAIRLGRGRPEQLGRIATTGVATGRYLEKYGLSPSLIPQQYVAEALGEALIAQGVKGKRIVIPRAEEAREVLPEMLREAGAEVVVAPVYRTTMADGSGQLLEDSADFRPDLLTFASSKTARHFAIMLDETGMQEWFDVPAAVIGPVTGETALELGFRVAVMPDAHTIQAMVEAIEVWYATR